MKRLASMIISIILMITTSVAEEGHVTARTAQDMIEELAVYYGTYGSEAEEKTAELLDELCAADPVSGAKWGRIMQLWKTVNEDSEINENILPDGLPETDELCMIVLGFQLNPDGSMKDELIERLTVAKASAEKYPNSLVVCTGGGTAVIVEDQSLTTAQNAIYTYRILTEQYPQVKQLAIISSDYHIATGTLLFGAEATLQAEEAGKETMTVVSNAAWHAPSGTLSTMFQAGALIELSGDVETAFEIYYETYDIHELPAIHTVSDTPTLDRICETGVLRVGTAGDYKPMSFLEPETGTYWGFDTELAEDLASSLGVEIEYVPTSWPTLMEDTQTGQFDLAICGITVTDARKEQALMSDGYLQNGKTVLCRAEDAERYTSLEAINRPEVRVMENPGGLNEKFARENLPDATLIIHDINQEIPGLVASGEADVMITEIMEAEYYVGQDSRLAAPLIYEPFTDGQLGILMPKGSEDLLEYVNQFLDDEKKTGRLDELAEQYIYRYIMTEEEQQPAA